MNICTKMFRGLKDLPNIGWQFVKQKNKIIGNTVFIVSMNEKTSQPVITTYELGLFFSSFLNPTYPFWKV